ncbi:hypothetical protein H4R33_002919 [Dimargaris cristalligena]|nr:hypothetical protein H4R33_002919 [Dimargaris cristalligena]
MKAPHNQWMFKVEDFGGTPSVMSGNTPAEETVRRAKACRDIFYAGLSLRLSHITIATACAMFHRFYMRHSLKEYNPYNIAATSLYLATKVEEQHRKLKDVIVAVHMVFSRKKDAPALVEGSTPRLIAASALYLAFRVLNEEPSTAKWWEQFELSLPDIEGHAYF